MAQAVIRWSLTAGSRPGQSTWNFGGQSDKGTGLSTSSSVLPCQYHSTVALHTYIYGG
jgi:hypothetical protein